MRTFQIDADIQFCLDRRPDMAPGERIVAGKLYVYDADLKLSFLARDLVQKWSAAGLPLTTVSNEVLEAISSACMRRRFDTRGQEMETNTLFAQVEDERVRRASQPEAA